MLGGLLTEQRNPESSGIDQLATLDMLRVINQEDAKVASAVERELPHIAQAVDAITAVLEARGRLFYIGAGTSGRLGVLDAAECGPTFSVPPDWVQGVIAGGEPALARATEASEDDRVEGVHDLLSRGFQSADILAGVAASGRTPYVLGAIAEANRMGAVTIGISCVPGSELSRLSKIAITPVTGPEVIAGSTRLKAGTATKLVLNMLTTGTFIRMGYVYGNMMVNVAPSNDKLRDRALRIIGEICGLEPQAAARLLAEANYRVPTAIVMALAQVDCAQAESRLLLQKGNIRKAVQET